MEALEVQLARNLALVTVAAEVGGRAALPVAGQLLVTEVKRIISQPYPPASQPGEPPHRRRGEEGGLLGAYTYWMEGEDMVAVGSPGTDPEEQAVFLELGTSKMRPRPHLRPAVANVWTGGGSKSVLREVFAKSVERSIRAAIR